MRSWIDTMHTHALDSPLIAIKLGNDVFTPDKVFEGFLGSIFVVGLPVEVGIKVLWLKSHCREDVNGRIFRYSSLLVDYGMTKKIVYLASIPKVWTVSGHL